MKVTINSAKTLFCLLIAGFLVLSFSQSQVQAQAQSNPGAAPGSVLNSGLIEVDQGVQPFARLLDEDSIYNTTVFTFGEVVLFSYTDGTEISMINNFGEGVLDITLNKDEYHIFEGSSGIYRIFGSTSFTALVGDATGNIVHGWYAVDQSGRGTSTFFNTYMMAEWDGRERFIVAAYEDDTDFTIRNLDTGALLHAGSLNAGEFYTMNNTPFDTFVQVQASKPVSALSYGDTDYYVPASNGTFTGTLFLGYSSYIGNWTNSITVTGYHDDTSVTIINTVTDAVIGEYTINEGQVNSIGITQPTYWRLESDKPVTAGNIPYANWTGNYLYKTRAVDSGGFGAGTLFYMPTIGSRIDVFSFENDNEVHIQRLGREIDYPYENPVTLFEGSLDAGEAYTFTSTNGRWVYKIESEENVSVIQSNGGAGAEFMPLSFVQSLPDLAVSSNGIIFDPQQETYTPGQEIEINVLVSNLGPVSAESVVIDVYDGDPEGGGIAPLLHRETVPVIAGNSIVDFTFPYTVPESPEYRQIVVIADPDNQIVESNNANNKASRFLVPNDDLLPPIAVTVVTPNALGLDDNLELFPNPFQVSATLLNTGEVDAENVTVTFTTLDGLAVEEGEIELNVGDLQVGQSIDLEWTLSADPDVTGLNRFAIQVNADNSESKDVLRGVNVPSPIPAATRLLSPSQGEEEVELLPTMLWAEIGIADTYDLQLSNSQDFSNLLIDESGLTANEYQPESDLEAATTYYWRVRGVNFLGAGEWAVGHFTTTTTLSSPGDENEHPRDFILSQNYPNPFNPSTQIRYALPEQGHVTLTVYTIMGEQVAVLTNEVQSAGWHQVTFDASRFASGVYLYQLRSNNRVETKRMLLIK